MDIKDIFWFYLDIRHDIIVPFQDAGSQFMLLNLEPAVL
jgi:hypothetical protein